jgi:hypothetical protein
MQGNGHLHGVVDDQGLISGDNIAYIYPDGETAFLGQFKNKFMKKAYGVDVLAYGCNENGIMEVSKYSKPVMGQAYFYEPPTNVSFGGGAPLETIDPYEMKTAILSESSVPNSGEGVIAKKDIPKFRMVCMYSLYLYSYPEEYEIYEKTCYNNPSKSDDYRRQCKKYSLTLSYYHDRIDLAIDLPPDFDGECCF